MFLTSNCMACDVVLTIFQLHTKYLKDLKKSGSYQCEIAENKECCYRVQNTLYLLFIRTSIVSCLSDPLHSLHTTSYSGHSASASLWFQRSLGCSQESPFPSRGGRGAASATTNGGRKRGRSLALRAYIESADWSLFRKNVTLTDKFPQNQ